MWSVLLLCGLVSTAAGIPGPVGVTEGLPEGQVEEYFDTIADAVKTAFNSPTPLADLNWGIDHIFGIPFKIRLTTKNGVLQPPTEVRRISDVNGVQEMSGTAHIKGFLYLGRLIVSYEEFGINIFGLEMKGRAEARLHNTIAPVNLQVFNNAVVQKKPLGTIGEFKGLLTIHLGSGTYFQEVCNLILDALFFLKHIDDVFRWALFESIIEPLETAITNAASGLL